MVMTPAPRAARTLVITGALFATRMVRVNVQLQVTGPLADCRVVVSVIVPETVPVWIPRFGLVNVAAVLPAGTVKVAGRPPVENTIAGSSDGTVASDAKVRATVPVMGTGNVLPNARVTGCCWAGGGVSVTPPIVTPLTCGRPIVNAKRLVAVRP